MRKIIQDNLLPGVSGMMRVKNDGQFIEACVESCISALDELIIVWNDCTDNSTEVIERMRQRYPDKIKTYEYKYKVYSTNLTKDEYEYAKSLPKDSPHLLCNYYNFCLSKVTREYAVKIDADQMYFTDKMQMWCDFYRSRKKLSINLSIIGGYLIALWHKVVMRINRSTKIIWHLLPSRMPQWMKTAYFSYSKYVVSKYNYAVVLSGLNIVKFENEWYVPLGMKNETQNILPPFNGAGDHLFFKVTNKCYYEILDDPFYSQLLSNEYNLIEKFHNPYKTCCGGYFWYHVNMMRPNMHDKLKIVFEKYRSRFIEKDTFVKFDFYKICKMIDSRMYEIPTRSFSQFVYPFSAADLINKVT